MTCVAQKTTPAVKATPKSGHVRILEIGCLKPSPENDSLYRPIDMESPDMQALVQSIRQHGLKEPLVATTDGWILSGHRRHAAAKAIGLKGVPCRFEQFRRTDDPERFLVLLREYNRQREKTLAEKLREEVVSVNPDDAYQALIAYREQQSVVTVDTIDIRSKKQRATITGAKTPLLTAAKKIIDARRRFWPLSDRQIHYALLNAPPLIHASKPASTYRNNLQSYKAIVDLLTRARLAGLIPMEAIADETRPESSWLVFDGVQSFIRQQMGDFLRGYWRDLMQSQPNHVEIVGEKLTVKSIVDQVAMRYRIPTTIGRGYCSIPPRHKIAQRFRKSGKDKLILLVVSDFDPDGEEIAHSLARSLRDDFDVRRIEPVKVALTADQVADLELPPMLKAKAGSAAYERFTDRHGTDVFELEAVPPETLQSLLQAAIDSVIDVDAFNAEIDREKDDAAFLASVRGQVLAALKEMRIEGIDGDQEA
jgi:hypothetical protein